MEEGAGEGFPKQPRKSVDGKLVPFLFDVHLFEVKTVLSYLEPVTHAKARCFRAGVCF